MLINIKNNLNSLYRLRVITDDPYLPITLKREAGINVIDITVNRPVKTVSEWVIRIQGKDRI
jgi:hypothetical protein